MKPVIFWAYAGNEGHVAYRFFFDDHYKTWMPHTNHVTAISFFDKDDRARLICLFREDSKVWNEIP